MHNVYCSGSGDEAECGSDTSCSEDSFEMSSAIEEPTTDEGSKANRGKHSFVKEKLCIIRLLGNC